MPLIVEKDHRCATLDDLENPKFLMPKTFQIAEVQAIIRRKLSLSKEKGLFLLVNNGKEIVRSNDSLETVFDKHKDTDGFLYILYTEEEIYGHI